jgi:hypothetical protein
MREYEKRAAGTARYVLIVALLVCAVSVPAQNPQLARDATVYGRQALLVGNDKLEVAIVKQGGSMLRIVIKGDPDGLSPFGNPEMMPQIPENRKLQGPMVGHFVCVDGFGGPSNEERAAGLPMHGEAYLQPWNLATAEKQGGTTTVKFNVDLPLLQESLTRTLQMVDGENVIYVDSEVESRTAFDRPMNWGEHPYLFPPFLEAEKTVVDISGTRSRTRTYPAGRERMGIKPSLDFTWPTAQDPAGKALDLSTTPTGADWMGHTTTMMEPSRRLVYATALNTARRYLLGYLFRREEFPWIQCFMNYSPDGWVARALEYATQPFDTPRRQSIGLNTMFDAPTYRWLPAKSKVSSAFILFYLRTPPGMTGVKDVRSEPGKIVIEGRNGEVIAIPASRSL